MAMRRDMSLSGFVIVVVASIFVYAVVWMVLRMPPAEVDARITVEPRLLEQVPLPTQTTGSNGPHLVHEVCAQRPRYLKCTGGGVGQWCGTYEVMYEHHCDCDTWAP